MKTSFYNKIEIIIIIRPIIHLLRHLAASHRPAKRTMHKKHIHVHTQKPL